LAVSSVLSVNLWFKYSSADRIIDLSNLTYVALNLVHELQKERGMSAGFVGSGGKKFKTKLPQQRNKVDERLKDFLKLIEKSTYSQRVKTVFENLENIESMRARVDELSVNRAEVVRFYTEINEGLIGLIGTLVKEAQDTEVATRIVALKEFSSAKDLAGIKRALLSVAFARDSMDKELLKSYMEINGKEKAFLKSFRDIAPELYIKRFDDIKKSEEFAEAEGLERLALSREGNYGIDAEHWFEVQTRRIDLLKKMEDFMLEDVKTLALEIKNSELTKFLSITGITGSVLVITFLFVYRTLRVVSERIEKVVGRITAIAESMEFKANNLVSESKDEFYPLKRALTRMLKSIGETVETLKTVMGRLSQGFFNQKIEGNFRGDIKILMNSINSSLDNLKRTMDSIKEVMEAVAKGNLRKRIEDGHSGDLKELTDYINSSLDDLQKLLLQIREDIIRVTSNTASITTSVDETSEAIRQISEETQKARNISIDMGSTIEEGKDKVNVMHTAMSRIIEVSRNISSITETIITIAEQTNLIALNAAIEAARAGEAGRGFAVVADEVRRLAELSGNAAKEIEELLGKALETVEEGREASEAVVESYAKIEKVTREISVVIDTIATAMEEQSRAVDIIRDNITDISRSTERIEENINKFEL
jgi:methyl-accepting chemotaxis protein